MNLGLEAIREEVARNGTEADKECLAYVLDMEAGSSDKAFQGGLKRDCDKDGCVLPSRLTAEGRGMRLSDFVAHEDAVLAGLREAHVAALRFYTTAAFATINNGLRDQETSDPFPAAPTADIHRSNTSSEFSPLRLATGRGGRIRCRSRWRSSKRPSAFCESSQHRRAGQTCQSFSTEA